MTPSFCGHFDEMKSRNRLKLLLTTDCMKRWKAIRGRFVRELKRVKERRSGDPGPPYVPSWELFNALMFLQDSVRHRKQDIYLQFHSYTVTLLTASV